MDAQGNAIPCPDKTEPKGSASSSLDEKCRNCDHSRVNHRQGTCVVCAVGFNERHCTTFAPARGETAGEPERPDRDCIRLTGCRDKLKRGCAYGCREAADDLTRLGEEMEPETPECDGCGHPAHRAGHCSEQADGDNCPCDEPIESGPCPSCGQQAGTWFDRSVCAEPCSSAHNRCANCGAVTGDACLNEAPPEPEAPPRRPPYAVAYAIEGGAQYEIALPGDATVRPIDGALVITHASAILALTNVRPLEGA